MRSTHFITSKLIRLFADILHCNCPLTDRLPPTAKSRVKFEMQISDQKLSELLSQSQQQQQQLQLSLSQSSTTSSSSSGAAGSGSPATITVTSARGTRAASVAIDSSPPPAASSSMCLPVTRFTLLSARNFYYYYFSKFSFFLSGGSILKRIEKSFSDRRIQKLESTPPASLENSGARHSLRVSNEHDTGSAPIGVPAQLSSGSVTSTPNLSSSPPNKNDTKRGSKDKKKEKREKKEKSSGSTSGNTSATASAIGSPRSMSPAPASTGGGSRLLQRQSSGRVVTLTEPPGRAGSPRRDQSPAKEGAAVRLNQRTPSGSSLRSGLSGSNTSASPTAPSTQSQRLNCITIMLLAGDAGAYRTLCDKLQAEMKLE